MGYYTYFELTHEVEPKCKFSEKEIQKKVAETLSKRIFGDAHELTGSDLRKIEDGKFDYNYKLFYDSLKWYEYDEDMIALSKELPGVYFTLSGNGEYDDDFWIAVYHEGEGETFPGRIVYPGHDERRKQIDAALSKNRSEF